MCVFNMCHHNFPLFPPPQNDCNNLWNVPPPPCILAHTHFNCSREKMMPFYASAVTMARAIGINRLWLSWQNCPSSSSSLLSGGILWDNHRTQHIHPSSSIPSFFCLFFLFLVVCFWGRQIFFSGTTIKFPRRKKPLSWMAYTYNNATTTCSRYGTQTAGLLNNNEIACPPFLLVCFVCRALLSPVFCFFLLLAHLFIFLHISRIVFPLFFWHFFPLHFHTGRQTFEKKFCAWWAAAGKAVWKLFEQ